MTPTPHNDVSSRPASFEVDQTSVARGAAGLARATSRSRQRRDALLASAAVLIVRHGLEQFTTQNLAEKARISIGTVYRYFADRTDILDALDTQLRHQLRQRLQHAPLRPSTIVAEIAQFCTDQPAFAVLAVRRSERAHAMWLNLDLSTWHDPTALGKAKALAVCTMLERLVCDALQPHSPTADLLLEAATEVALDLDRSFAAVELASEHTRSMADA